MTKSYASSPASRSLKLNSAGRRVAARASASSVTTEKKAVIEKLLGKVGTKNGLDRTSEQQTTIKHDIAELASSSGDSKLDLTGSHWTLRYSDSTSSSAGKLGPFIGYVEQEFPADRQGIYYNKVQCGILKAKLTADYEYEKDNKINVSFTAIQFMLGPFKYQPKNFTGRGHWILRYTDPHLRVLDTNADHVFVLERLQMPKLDF